MASVHETDTKVVIDGKFWLQLILVYMCHSSAQVHTIHRYNEHIERRADSNMTRYSTGFQWQVIKSVRGNTKCVVINVLLGIHYICQAIIG